MAAIIRQLQEENAHTKELLDTAHHNLQEERMTVIKRESRIQFLEGQVHGLTRPLGTGKTEGASNDR